MKRPSNPRGKLWRFGSDHCGPLSVLSTLSRRADENHVARIDIVLRDCLAQQFDVVANGDCAVRRRRSGQRGDARLIIRPVNSPSLRCSCKQRRLVTELAIDNFLTGRTVVAAEKVARPAWDRL